MLVTIICALLRILRLLHATLKRYAHPVLSAMVGFLQQRNVGTSALPSIPYTFERCVNTDADAAVLMEAGALEAASYRHFKCMRQIVHSVLHLCAY